MKNIASHEGRIIQMAVDSSFSVDAFVTGTQEGAGDTRRLRIEPGEYNAMIVGPLNDPKGTKVKSEKGYVIFEVVWQPDDSALASKLNVDKLPTCRQSIFLDVTGQNALDMGPFKNSDLNKLREVFNLNAAGVKWSFADFIGKVARIKVEHRPNVVKPDDPYVNVTAVTKL